MSTLSENIRFLRRSKGLTQEDLAVKLGVNRAMIGSYEEGRAVPKLSVLQLIAHSFQVSVDDLIGADIEKKQISGETADIQGSQLRILTTVVDNQNREMITLVPAKAAAGYLNGYGDPQFVENLPQFRLPFPELSKERTYRAFQIIGESMEPIPNGAYVICEYVQNWQSIKDGQTYVLVTRDEGIVYKRVYHQNMQLMLRSDNPEYKSYSIGLTSLMEVWKAQGYICLNLPEPEQMNYHQLTAVVSEMKKELQELKNKNPQA